MTKQLSPVNLKRAETFAFCHPERAAELIGCSLRQIRDGFDSGAVPYVTPFATGKKGERPTRFVDVEAWLKKASE